MRIYLTGFMGVGKSTVGRLLASQLACPFVDLDAAIEAQAEQSISEIFALSGEPGFRELEEGQLRHTAQFDSCVVATGGGTPVAAANRLWMRAQGSIVWLAAPFEELRERVREAAAERPLWSEEAKARQLFEQRLEVYGDCDLAIETAGRAPREVVGAVIAGLKTSGLR